MESSFSQAKIDRKNAELNNENAHFQQAINSTAWKSEEEIKGDGGSPDRHHSQDEHNMDFTECLICRIEYNDKDRYPMVLSCGHTLCQECIKQISQKEPEVKCPKCKATLEKYLAKNYELLSAIEWSK